MKKLWIAAVGAAAVMCLPMNASASEGITKENFDYVRYADDYQDLKAAFGYDAEALYNHYVTCGIAEQRIAHSIILMEDFDHVRYADDYQDLKAAFGYDAEALYNHYLGNGMAEGRIAYKNDGSVIGAAAQADDAAGAAEADTAAETGTAAQTGNNAGTNSGGTKIPNVPGAAQMIRDGWEWHSGWGMWVR